ncbi:plasmid SOS inhibition protein A [Erwinia tracheiphila PSU-1]|nr:plasmid SOS inhibition protein A [Erwinia tracheiphila PSU-1]
MKTHGNVIPRHLALVPHCPYASAIALATAEVEARSLSRGTVGESAYAHAFLRHLCGCKTVRAGHLRRVVPLYVPSSRSAPPMSVWRKALDVLIASRGEICPLPLPSDTASLLFPAVYTA